MTDEYAKGWNDCLDRDKNKEGIILKLGKLEEIECPEWLLKLDDHERSRTAVEYNGTIYTSFVKIYRMDGSFYIQCYNYN